MLRVDPLLAAQHFNWLILSIPLNAAMLNGEETTCSRRQLGTGERERSAHA
jgi:TetR/AcrR family transcriptional regulator, mexJK operon transcriptional repressor